MLGIVCDLLLQPMPSYAQEQPATPITTTAPSNDSASLSQTPTTTDAQGDKSASAAYTVVAGDSLYAIAERFGVSVDAIVAVNQIQDATLIRVGQQLLIPGADQAGSLLPPFAPQSIATITRQAQPGDTLAHFAQRYGQTADLLAALNPLTVTQRLFPGQPVAIPQIDTPVATLRFGAVTNVILLGPYMQGRTGWIFVKTNRPLTPTLAFAGLSLPLQPLSEDQQNFYALMPVPALFEPGAASAEVGYTTRSGQVVSHTWPIEVLDGGYFAQDIVIPPERSGLLATEIIQGELAKLVAIWSTNNGPLAWSETFARPIAAEYQTSSLFGTRRDYNDGLYATFHAGQDFSAPVGIPVTAPAAGTVIFAEPLQVRGNAILLDHGGGVYTGYWHLSEFRVNAGQRLQRGDLLGLVGNTGLSTGAHLHWELRIYGVAVDPMQFLSEPLLRYQ